jgi:hypothetical protein
MKIHDKIYLQYFDDDGEPHEEVHWCEDRQFDRDVEYVIADKINKLKNGVLLAITAHKTGGMTKVEISALEKLIEP